MRSGCQTDLLIETRYTIYVCEIKFHKKIEKSVIPGVSQKMQRLVFPKRFDAARHSVKTHSAETSVLTKRFASKIGLDLIGELLGLLHDFGKYSFEYQCYIKSAVGLFVQAGYRLRRSPCGSVDRFSASKEVRNILMVSDDFHKLIIEFQILIDKLPRQMCAF